MKPFVWNPEMSVEETKNGAYWERNMLALLFATILSDGIYVPANQFVRSGWYTHGEYEGWSRVISLFDGRVTFHVPDDFDIGRLPEIQPNWDGHTTEEKWNRAMRFCGVNIE